MVGAIRTARPRPVSTRVGPAVAAPSTAGSRRAAAAHELGPAALWRRPRRERRGLCLHAPYRRETSASVARPARPRGGRPVLERHPAPHDSWTAESEASGAATWRTATTSAVRGRRARRHPLGRGASSHVRRDRRAPRRRRRKSSLSADGYRESAESCHAPRISSPRATIRRLRSLTGRWDSGRTSATSARDGGATVLATDRQCPGRRRLRRRRCRSLSHTRAARRGSAPPRTATGPTPRTSIIRPTAGALRTTNPIESTFAHRRLRKRDQGRRVAHRRARDGVQAAPAGRRPLARSRRRARAARARRCGSGMAFRLSHKRRAEGRRLISLNPSGTPTPAVAPRAIFAAQPSTPQPRRNAD